MQTIPRHLARHEFCKYCIIYFVNESMVFYEQYFRY
jgi:hypothetical protein